MRERLERLRTKLFLMKQQQLEKLILRYSKLLMEHVQSDEWEIAEDGFVIDIFTPEYEA